MSSTEVVERQGTPNARDRKSSLGAERDLRGIGLEASRSLRFDSCIIVFVLEMQSDGVKAYKDIYAYNQLFGFYDTGKELPKEMFDFVAIDISESMEIITTNNTLS